jgi:hypothetical protein
MRPTAIISHAGLTTIDHHVDNYISRHGSSLRHENLTPVFRISDTKL